MLDQSTLLSVEYVSDDCYNIMLYTIPSQLRDAASLGDGIVYLLAANRGFKCSLTRAMDGRIVRCDIISPCGSAATSDIVNRLWSRV